MGFLNSSFQLDRMGMAVKGGKHVRHSYFALQNI